MLQSLLAAGRDLFDDATGNAIPWISISESLLYALLGFIVTFIGIILLIFIVWLCGKAVNRLSVWSGKKKEPAQTAETAAEEDGISDEVRVAIIAALAAYYADEAGTSEFKVKRIKRL